ncbi:hypothetical protein BDA99DRAFT_549366 [Phascolomyces articulosus]|uniref:Chromo domain-containing protein n=1 Tax=Phascolomyces articulosus TaxID=60185 RepID=A0AAD5JXH7_9FUNG|nr:hypothetical protein BDA99DRAFT_549366 [Phascolomyces articulosus]
MKIYNKVDKRDVIAVDGDKNIKLNDNNFFYPIRKEPNEDLNKEEKHFNNVFGSFRSSIENVFNELGNTFKRFSNNNSTLKTDDYKYTNIQLKHHKLWCEKHFEFPTNNKLIDIILNNQIKQMEKIKIMTELQSDFSDLNIEDDIIIDKEEDNENISTNNNEDIDFPEYNNVNKKKRKKGKNINKNNNFYKIENIIEHDLNKNGDYKFLVKWKVYDILDNSWVNKDDFNEKTIIKEYFNKQKIKY